jgi:predicted RNase H-like HicB family nuclease
MHGSTRYDAYLEGNSSGTWRARILDLSGCWADGKTEHDALRALVAEIPAYFAWLRDHDEYMPIVSGPFEVCLRESAAPQADQPRGAGAFFAPDGEPVGAEALDWDLALLGWAYDDLLAAAARASYAPPAASALTYVARAQLWLLAAFDPALAADAGAVGTTADSLPALSRAALASLRASTLDQRSAVRASEGEQWTLRKVLRRSIELVREATPGSVRAANRAG